MFKVINSPNLWKKLFVILGILIAAINIIGIIYLTEGWDFEVYRSAVKSVEEGYNPYYLINLLKYQYYPLPFIYLPTTLFVFKGIVFFSKYLDYRIIWFIFLILSFFIVKISDRHSDSFYLSVIFLTAFMAAFNNFRTGNIGLIELFLLSLVFFYLKKKKDLFAGAFLVLVAWFKLVPLLFAGGYLFFKEKYNETTFFKLFIFKKKILLITFIGSLFMLIILSSILIFPNLTKSFFLSITGQINNQPSPLHDYSHSFFCLIKDTISMIYARKELIYFIYLIYLIFIIAFFFQMVKKSSLSPIETFSLWIITLMLILPRLHSYSYIYAIIPIYYLTKEKNYKIKFIILIIISLVPLILAGVTYFIRFIHMFEILGKEKILIIARYRYNYGLLGFFLLTPKFLINKLNRK